MYRFSATTIALLVGYQVVCIQRDNLPNIPSPDLWELPGGGAIGHETPWQCIAREVYEELRIILPQGSVIWEKRFPDPARPDQILHFMVAPLPAATAADIRLGSEGQRCTLLPIADFLNHPHAVTAHQHMLRDYLRLQGMPTAVN